MPIYEYRCEKNHTFDVMQRITDDPVTTCTTCGRPVERVFHPVAVHFKGSGFYNTDYGTRKRQRETAAAAESGAEKTEAKSAEKSADKKKSETKSAGKSAEKTAPAASSGTPEGKSKRS